ncbi:MAG: 2-amino-4-hydroxy-6-hydroxymethyldihydropteridine diphosphokinase [Acidimicrobiia bacterium]
MAEAIIALGSNLGDRLDHLRAGVRGVEALGDVTAVSSLYETEPVGGPSQGRYLNAVVVLDTSLGPEDLLVALHQIEGQFDRTRDVHWGPRTLDLDIIAYDDVVVDSADLQIPHPRAHERHFVLAPLVEVRPEIILADGSRAAYAIESVRDQVVERWEGAWRTEPPRLGREANLWVAGQVLAFAVWLGAILRFGTGLAPLPILGVGAVLTVGGVVQGFAAVRSFGTTITPSPQPRAGSNLVSTGIYGKVRHPMYGAILLAFFGTALMAGSWEAQFVTGGVAGFLYAKSVREERILDIVVPGYGEFRRRVTYRFIPYVW